MTWSIAGAYGGNNCSIGVRDSQALNSNSKPEPGRSYLETICMTIYLDGLFVMMWLADVTADYRAHA
jgi:hypothetical protein